MESPVSNSFIPQDATTAQVSRRSGHGGGLKDLFMLLSIVLFIASAALAVGMFLYSQYLNSQANVKAGEIQQAKATFNTSLVTTIETLSNRIKSSETLLSQHLAPTAFFEALDQSTLQTISFQTLDLDASDPSNITIKMTGVAQSVNSIAYQAQLFSTQQIITNPIFSGIDREVDGVHFNLTATVNSAAINYSQLLQAAQSGQSSAGINPSPQVNASSSAAAAPSALPASGAPGAPSSQTTQQ